MTKLDFINELGQRLSPLPTQEVTGLLNYYTELIDDRMDDGMSEEEAVASLGDIGELAQSILENNESPLLPAQKDISSAQPNAIKKKRRLSPILILLLILGSPVWISIGAGVFSVVISLYAVLWVLVFVLLIVSIVCIASGLFSAVAAFFASVIPGTFAVRLLACGSGIMAMAIGILLLPASVWIIRKFAGLHKLAFQKIFRRKEASK